jgi:hypothetical protein
MKYQFQTLGKNELVYPVHDNFMNAWLDMYHYVKKKLNTGDMNPQLLETALWIEVTEDGGIKHPIMFYDAMGKALNDGWPLPI